MSGSGYGDRLSVEELLAEKEGLLQIMARERAADDLDDVVQEGRIALWRTAEARPEASEAYLHGAARLRIKEYAIRQNPTGRPSMQGRRQVEPTVFLDAARNSDDEADDAIMLLGAEVLEGLELAHHHGEIMRALAALTEPQRRYVVLRFWGGLNDAEIAAKVAVRQDTLQRMWSRRIRPTLATELRHLAGAA